MVKAVCSVFPANLLAKPTFSYIRSERNPPERAAYARPSPAPNRRDPSAARVRVLGPHGKVDADEAPLPVADDREGRSLARAERAGDDPDHVLRVRNRTPVDRDDDVAAAAEDGAVELLPLRCSEQAGPVARAAGEDRVDERAVAHGEVQMARERRRQILGGHTDVRV